MARPLIARGLDLRPNIARVKRIVVLIAKRIMSSRITKRNERKTQSA